MREDFEFWWDKEGQYSELCGKELCLIAWSNGEYKATYTSKTITDKEMQAIATKHGVIVDAGCYEFVKEILLKAQEK